MIYFTFNANNLNLADTFEVLDITKNPPKVVINKYQLARADGEIVTNQRYGERTIIVTGRILAEDVIDMQTKLDLLETYLLGKNLPLYVHEIGIVRKYIATKTGLTTEIQGYKCNWTVEFTAEAFGEETSTTPISITTPYISSPTLNANDFGGTYSAQPEINITVNWVEPYWSNKYLEIKNTYTSKALRITREWGLYDNLIIKCKEKTCWLYPTTKLEVETCDSNSGWTSSDTLSVDSVNMKEGTGCLKNVMTGARIYCDFIKLNFTPINASVGTMIVPIFIPTPIAGTVAAIRFYVGSNANLSANYNQYNKTTQFDGSAIATNAWNYFGFSMTAAPNATNGTPNMSAIKSMMVRIYGTSGAMNLSNALLDYITLQSTTAIGGHIDYDGIFPEWGPGTQTIIISDDFTNRNIAVDATYYKRYL